jgi:signal transduction histidine kinase
MASDAAVHVAAYAVYAQAGAIALALLMLLHGLVWRLQRQRWSLLLAIGFGLGALNYGLDGQMAPSVARATVVGGLTTASGLVLMTLALIEYVGLPVRARRRAMALVVGLALAVLGLRLAGLVPRIVASATFAVYFLLQAGLMLWALRREPRSGHGLVLAALLLYPAVFIAVLAGAFDGAMLRYLVIVPTAVTGGTILTTGLLRAQRRAEAELAARQRAEDELRRLNDTLEQRVAQRTRELHEMVAGLESFNRSVSHDLRGPLGGMAGVARLASEAVARGDLLTVQRLLSAIEAQADSSSQLVAALLALARVGEIQLAPEPIALGAFVRETLAQMDLADPGEAEVPVRLQPLPAVEADPALLRQVLVNLLGNARKFSRQAVQPQVEVSSETRADGQPVIHVRDNGVGYDPAQADALFEPFKRLHPGQFSGHGVGLSIVKRIVERHGGRVWASGNPGGGAIFSFTLGTVRRPH